MARPNLLKIDDILLRAGRWLGALWLLGSAAGLVVVANAGSGLVGPSLLALAFGSAPIGLLAAGFQLRRREHRAWALHRLVDDHVEISASDLLRGSDFTPDSLDRAIRDLNNSGAAFLVWDRGEDVVQDGRLRGARIQIEVCGSCSAKVSLSLRVGQASSARCPYCNDPLASPDLVEEKARLIDELDADPTPPSNQPASSFSPVTFVGLTLVFWPLGIVYAFRHWRACQGAD